MSAETASKVAFDGETGLLYAPPRAFDALFGAADGRPVTQGERALRNGLAASGALDGDRPNALLALALAAMRTPVCELRLARGDRSGRGWVDGRVAALLVPEPDGRLKLATLPTACLPAALARMNGLGPRPRVTPTVVLDFTARRLATLLAVGDATRVEGDGPHERATRSIVVGPRDHWRVEARWRPAGDSRGVRAVEVLDTPGGLWLVVPQGERVELRPTTPTAVFRLLAALLPRDVERAEGAGQS